MDNSRSATLLSFGSNTLIAGAILVGSSIIADRTGDSEVLGFVGIATLLTGGASSCSGLLLGIRATDSNQE
ncbi:MAG: hypothetical protein CMJ78_25045 [Planctomycetaceae bacterium]|nr:hypothetical protein [Planctomycetaceae bacterium]